MAWQRLTGWAFGFVIACWVMAVISFAVYQTFTDVTLINAAVNSALTIVVGLPSGAAAIAGLVRWRRNVVEANRTGNG